MLLCYYYIYLQDLCKTGYITGYILRSNRHSGIAGTFSHLGLLKPLASGLESGDGAGLQVRYELGVTELVLVLSAGKLGCKL